MARIPYWWSSRLIIYRWNECEPKNQTALDCTSVYAPKITGYSYKRGTSRPTFIYGGHSSLQKKGKLQWGKVGG